MELRAAILAVFEILRCAEYGCAQDDILLGVVSGLLALAAHEEQ